MKTTLQRLMLAFLMSAMVVGCSTAYDAYGRPRTVVEPGAALLGAAAAGFAGYAIARNRDDRHRNYRHYRHHRHHDHFTSHRYRYH